MCKLLLVNVHLKIAIDAVYLVEKSDWLFVLNDGQLFEPALFCEILCGIKQIYVPSHDDEEIKSIPWVRQVCTVPVNSHCNHLDRQLYCEKGKDDIVENLQVNDKIHKYSRMSSYYALRNFDYLVFRLRSLLPTFLFNKLTTKNAAHYSLHEFARPFCFF